MLLQLHEFQVLSKCLWLPNLDPSYLSTKASAHCPSNCGSVGWRFMPYTQSLGSPFPIREHTLLIGLIPGWATYGRQPINVSLSLSLKSINIFLIGFNLKLRLMDTPANLTCFFNFLCINQTAEAMCVQSCTSSSLSQ